MQQPPFFLNDNSTQGTIIASKKFFEREAVFSTLNLYTPHYYITVIPINESDIQISIQNKSSEPLVIDTLKKIFNDLIDQQIRVDLQKEFGQMRNRIVEHAFFAVSM